MADLLGLYLDENVSQRIADALVRRGIDVLTVREAGRASMPDEEQLTYATTIRRVFVTHDRGIRDAHWLHQPHFGVLFVPQETSSPEIVDWLEMVCSVLSADEIANRLEVYRP